MSVAPAALALRQDSSVLNLLRTTAILLVVIDHLFETLGPRHPVDWQFGRLGVLLFFVHTSCVLMMSLSRTPLSGAAMAVHFYIRRAFRIYPLSLMAVTLLVAFQIPPMAWVTTPPDSSLRTVAANLLLVQDLVGAESVSAPLWSLPLELQMYVFLPLAFVLIKRGASLTWAIGLWIVALVVGLAAPVLGLRLATFVPCFMSGVLAYCVAHRVRPSLPYWAWPVALCGLVALYVGLTGLSADVHPPAAGWVICLLTGVLVPQFREPSRAVAIVPEWIAKYSYGIYLSHMVTLYLAFRVLGALPLPLQWAAFLALTTGISVVAFHVVEAPLIKIGGTVANRVSARFATAGAPNPSPSLG